jgi:outer membrane protein assembly factor BamB
VYAAAVRVCLDVSSRRRVLAALLGLAALAIALVGCGGHGKDGSNWPLANLDHSSTRAQTHSAINRSNVGGLHVVWRFRFRIPTGDSGVFTATPVVVDGVVYIEDMKSNVFALDLATGRVLWRHLFSATNQGPDGLAVIGGRVYGATDSSAFALSAKTGRLLWSRFVVTLVDRFIDIAPQVANGIVYVSTIGQPPNGRGTLYALDAATGAVRWKFDTIKGPWAIPEEAAGGGAWYTPSVADGEVYWGIANPLPWGGSRAHPNGGAFAGPALYTDSLLVVDGLTGKLRWYDQVTTHDVRDHDFQLPPILGSIGSTPVVFGAGKAGIVIAWDRATHRRIWQTEVGIHRNDVGPLPTRQVSVCPGLLGGVLTPMAYAEGKLYLPIVDLCMKGGAYGYESFAHVDVAGRGKGEFVAVDASTGKHVWTRRLAQPDFGCATVADGVVFTATFDGTVYAFDTRDGSTLWRGRTRAWLNSCPAVAGHTLLVGAGVSKRGGVLELEALRP